MTSQVGRVLIYGGRGALGTALVEHFHSKNIWVISVDLANNEMASHNILVDPLQGWQEQEHSVLAGVDGALGGEKLDAVLCVAGGWAGGNAAHKDFVKNADLMWRQSVWSSALAAKIGTRFLKTNGLLQFTGAAAASDATPGMIGYGMAKAAVHQLVRSLADAKAAGLPEGTCSFALLPVTLDTPMNRKWMPKADHSSWTPLPFVAETLFKWTFEAPSGERPKSGSLVKLSTKEGTTKTEEQ
ncbi:hypothetical protein niasHT_003828 [Heterodera trifolii]|uniref:Dihydropteridine reductase n=1 Tax=Heterodera trifolii TaxID=157864 RepID=A0ABD2LUY0_9BILA